MDFFLGCKFLAVVVLDAVLGDPRWFPHPVRLMGGVIVRFEEQIFSFCQRSFTKKLAGVMLALGLPCGCYLIVHELIRSMDSLNETLGLVTWIVLGYTTLATRDLWDHATRVYLAMTEQGLSAARLALSQMVGRDTVNLSEADIVRATIESVAENSSDGIVAPLFYLAVGGPSLAMAYKAVNTLDSMIGYRNLRYQDVGWASARLDDLVNWIPARLTAGAISVIASWRLGTGKVSWRICRRDGGKHLSPNSGWPEAAMAGALGVQLGGVNQYEGLLEERATLGDLGGPLTPSLIPLALELMVWGSSLLAVMFFLMVVLW
jgi:adenosylcobinamide-phosphate synthase